MDSQTKRTITATLACILVLFAWLKLQEMWNPPLPPQAATEPTEAATSLPGEESSLTAALAPSSGPTNAASGDYAAASVEAAAPVVLGDDRQDDKRRGFHNPYEFAVTVTPREA